MHRTFLARLALALLIVSAFSARLRADWPAKVFAPYMYLGTGDTHPLTQCADATGQTFFTLAFIIADRQNEPAWYGRVAMDANYYADEIAAIRVRGGDVICSFGGEGGTELAIAETDPEKLLAKYQSILDRYHFTWLDFDIEGKGLKDSAANQRRDDVLAKLQSKNAGLRISFTLPVDPDGIGGDSRKMLADAKSKGVAVYSANVMTMYFGPRFSRGKKMSDVSFVSALKAYEQCQAIDPQIKIGMTPLIGMNQQMQEDFTLDDAKAMVQWSAEKPWVCSLAFWSGDRDSGRRRGRNNAAAAPPQEPWAYTRIFKQITTEAAAPASGPTTRPATQTAAPVSRVLILTGAGNHDWRATTPFLRRILADTGRFDVRVCESPVGLSAATLGEFDAVVDDCPWRLLGETSQQAISGYVKGGKGLVVTRGAMEVAGRTSGDWGEFGRITKVSEPPVADFHPAQAFPLIKIARPEHPIVAGMSETFKLADAPFPEISLTSGTQALAATQTGAAALFTSDYGNGRVVCTALGHDLAAMQEREFITIFARGVEWAATGSVTLGPDLGLPKPAANAVRTLLVTGGHDHEAGFYSLFDGDQDLTWTPVVNSASAFQQDLRGKYDVLILYDFTRDMDDKAKQNLRDFVESGKGVVVLHHALLDFQAWPWWYEQVVGGRYRLAPATSGPSAGPTSAAKMDQEIYVTPLGNHPIVARIGPFHITDETYKRMWISPDARPILSADSPNSDATVAWISPYEKSKVVYIQLGHGHGAFGHPSYRRIVHNAVLWSAGRLQ